MLARVTLRVYEGESLTVFYYFNPGMSTCTCTWLNEVTLDWYLCV